MNNKQEQERGYTSKMGRVSYSQFSQWDKCPYTWKLNYVDKAETFKGNIYTLFGSAIHETIQAYLVCYYERTLKEADSLPLDEILMYRMKENYKQSKERTAIFYTNCQRNFKKYL